MTINVAEIFYSIQGESLHQGRPCVFARLTGCNLRCSYCDTTYAFSGGIIMEIEDIMEQISKYKCGLVEITGGEPLLQEETPLLILGLLQAGHEVLLETNGTLDLGRVTDACVKIMDIKCPSSMESAHNNLQNLEYLNHDDQVKFVMQTREDYEFAKDLIPTIQDRIPDHHILFSPVTTNLKPDILAQWMLEDHLSARFQLQLHKIIWPAKDRGV